MNKCRYISRLVVGLWVCGWVSPLNAEGNKTEEPAPEWEWLIEAVDIRPDGAPVEVDWVVLIQGAADAANRSLTEFVSMRNILLATIPKMEEEQEHMRAAGIDASGGRVNFVHRGGFWTNDGLNVRFYRVERDEEEAASESIQTTNITKLGMVHRSEPSAAELQEKCSEEFEKANLVISPLRVDEAFSFSALLEDQKKCDLEQFRGKVVLLDWWATWCSPCLDKMPWLMDLSRRYESKGLVVISVNLDESRSQALRTLERFYLEDSIVQRWKSHGLFEGDGPLEARVLAGLRKRVDGLSSENERIVLSALKQLGVMDRMAAEQGDVFNRLGVSWKLFHVPKNIRECIQTLAGGSIPQLTIVGPDGVLRFHGYPHRAQVEEMLQDLLSSE